MKTVIGAKNNNSSNYVSAINKEYRKGYKIPGLDHQTNGIIFKNLWNSKQHIIRIIPGYDAEGNVFSQNINVNEYSTDAPYTDYLSDTFMMASTVNGFGMKSQSFITDYEPGSVDEQKFGGNTLIHWFTRNIYYSVNNKRSGKSRFKPIDAWYSWCSMNGPIKMDRTSLLMQALIIKSNGFFNKDQDGNDMVEEESGLPIPLFGVVSIDGTQSIKNILTALVEPMNPGLPLNPATNNKFGSLAECESNLLFLNPVVDTTSAKKINALKPSVQDVGKGWTPTPWNIYEEDVLKWWVPWDELIHYTTAVEQAYILANEFGADTVNYVIGSDPMFAEFEIPGDIKAAGLGRYATKPSTISQKPKAKETYKPITNNVSSINVSNSIDISEVKKQLSAIHSATKKSDTNSNRQNLASDLLEAEDDYESLANMLDGDGIEYE